MSQLERQQSILGLLKDFRGPNPLKNLFWSELNYERVNKSLSRRGWTDTANKALAEDPVLFAAGGQDDSFHVIYARLASDRLLLGHERPVVSRLLRDHPYALFVFSNHTQDRWHFLNVKYDDKTDKRRLFRRITIGPEERLRTATERLSLLDLESIGPDLFGLSPLAIHERHDEAFDVEAVQKDFFKVFADLYHKVVDDLAKVRGLEKEAGKLAQLLLDRMLFLYFIQKKGWLNQEPDYLYSRFRDCWKKDRRGHSYYSKVLYHLFLCLSDADTQMDAVGAVPFLNGGLFEESTKQTQAERLAQARLQIKNSTFRAIFDELLERFNFTVTEDTPLDVEVAIDPEMLGKIFESLILQLEKDPDTDLRKLTGSYYTPRPIVHFMCQEALKEYVVTELVGNESPKTDPVRQKLDTLLSLPRADQLDDEQVETLVKLFTDAEKKTIRQAILNCRVCDPAVGSGAFLVGMLHEIIAAVARLDLCIHGRNALTRRNYDYDLKTRIIESSLYGVDIQEQAVRLCELRLWLSLVVDYELDPNKPFAQAIREVPSLPNLSYRIVRGDSLLERLFGHVIHLDQMAKSPKTKQLIDSIQADKQAYFLEGNTYEKRRLEVKILAKQANLAEQLVDEKQRWLLSHNLSLFEESSKDRKLKEIRDIQEGQLLDLKRKIRDAKIKLERLSRQRGVLSRGDLDTLRRQYFHTGSEPTFMWRVDLAEVFVTNQGFDIVIANPPYIQMSMYPFFNNVMKEALICQYGSSMGRLNTFGFFIAQGIRLLSARGVLTYIIPNTILTQDYYEYLRQYMLSHCAIDFIVTFDQMPFESAIVENVVLCMRREQETNLRESTETKVISSISAMGEYTVRHTVRQETFNKLRKSALNPNIDEKTMRIWESMKSDSVLLSDIVNINQAIALKSDRSAHLFNQPRGKNYKPVLDGRDIQPFVIRWPGTYLRYDLRHIHSCKRQDIFLAPEKLFVRRVAEKIVACYDDDQFYALNTLVVLTPKSGCPLSIHALCGLLNSNLMTELYVMMFKSSKRVFSEVQARQLGAMPLPNPSTDKNRSLISEIERIASQIHEFGKIRPELSFEDILTSKYYLSRHEQLDVLVQDLYGVTKEL